MILCVRMEKHRVLIAVRIALFLSFLAVVGGFFFSSSILRLVAALLTISAYCLFEVKEWKLKRGQTAHAEEVILDIRKQERLQKNLEEMRVEIDAFENRINSTGTALKTCWIHNQRLSRSIEILYLWLQRQLSSETPSSNQKPSVVLDRTVEEVIHGLAEVDGAAAAMAARLQNLALALPNLEQMINSAGEGGRLRKPKTKESLSGIAVEIVDLADRSNILAINASIEAARIGQEGKGFSVIASEMQLLAQQTRDIAANMSELSKADLDLSAGQTFPPYLLPLKKEIETLNKTNSSLPVYNSGAVEGLTGILSELKESLFSDSEKESGIGKKRISQVIGQFIELMQKPDSEMDIGELALCDDEIHALEQNLKEHITELESFLAESEQIAPEDATS